MQRIPVICGPTSGGKSDLALALARLVQGSREGRDQWPGGAAILAADAFQVYRGLDIASAKPTPCEQATCPHRLIDLVEPDEAFSASAWLDHAKAALDECARAKRLPIIVGGTHLYIKLLVDGMFDGPAADPALRELLRARGLLALRSELERVDPVGAKRIHPNDERRTIRALEVFHLTGQPISSHQTQWEHGQDGASTDASSSPYCMVVLDWPIDAINRRINARVKLMMERGMLDEARTLHDRLGPTAREALGTKQLLDHLEGRCSLDDAIERVKIETRRFAKNQRTWLKRLRARPDAIVLDASAAPVDPATGLAIPPTQAWAHLVLSRLAISETSPQDRVQHRSPTHPPTHPPTRSP